MKSKMKKIGRFEIIAQLNTWTEPYNKLEWFVQNSQKLDFYFTSNMWYHLLSLIESPTQAGQVKKLEVWIKEVK